MNFCVKKFEKTQLSNISRIDTQFSNGVFENWLLLCRSKKYFKYYIFVYQIDIYMYQFSYYYMFLLLKVKV